MEQTVSKSQFKSQVLQYLRAVEEKKQPLIVTHGGKPVIKVSPYHKDADEALKSLRSSVVFYKNANKPVGEEDWETVK